MAVFDDWEGFDVQEERRIGKEEGIELQLIRQITKKLARGLDLETIAKEVEETPEDIKIIVEIAEKYAPDYNPDAIAEELKNSRNAQLQL